MSRKKNTASVILVKYAYILLGSILTAVGLEIFLKAHNLIGGGIIGTAVVVSYLTEIPLSLMILLLNFPFMYLEFKKQGRNILLPSIFALLSLIFWLWFFNPVFIENQDILQSTVFGGISLGIGSGLILRYGGYVDGMEYRRKALKIQLSSVTGSRMIVINLLILCLAGLAFGMEKAMYSLIAYFIVFKTIDITLELFEKTRKVIIISGEGEEIAQNIVNRLGKRVVFINNRKMQQQDKRILSCQTSNHELAELQSIIHDVDTDADIFFERKQEG